MTEGNRVHDLVADARAKTSELASDSPCRQAATASWFDRLAADQPPERQRAYLPNLLLHVYRLSVEQLRAFDADVAAVSAASAYSARVGDIGHPTQRSAW